MPPAAVSYIQRQDHSTEEAGRRLRRARERLNLKFRDVETASDIGYSPRHSEPHDRTSTEARGADRFIRRPACSARERMARTCCCQYCQS